MFKIGVRTVIALLVAGVGAGLLVAGVCLAVGMRFPYAHPAIAVLLALLSVALGYLGWQVRALRAGKSAKMHALRAAQVALGAQTATIFGVFTFAYLVVMLGFSLTHPEGSWQWQNWALGANALSSLVFAIVGGVVQYWCHIDEDDEGEGNFASAS
ncbi:MAG: DUF3180 family protein [Actinomycetaceae bacterium]|nr:DUF3180 family protein [Actinomycetaceae bacterium]